MLRASTGKSAKRRARRLATSFSRAKARDGEVLLPDRGGTRWRAAGPARLDPAGEGLWWFTAADGSLWRLAENPLKPEHLGATGKGDEHALLQQWANLLGDGVNGEVNGHHDVGAQIVVRRRRDFAIFGNGRIRMADGAPVRSGFSILAFVECSVFTVAWITFDGNRSRRIPKEMPAHNVQFLGCHRFRVSGVRSVDAVVDGFYIASPTPKDATSHCSDFMFDECVADGCFRQGMSIIQGHRGTLRNCVFTNTHGTAPQAGLDLESNPGNPDGSISDITIDTCRFVGNAGYGFQVSYMATPIEIELLNSVFEDNARGPILWGAGSGTIADCRFLGDDPTRNVIRTFGPKGAARFRLVRPIVGCADQHSDCRLPDPHPAS